MTDSILNSVKEKLGLTPDYMVFDPEIIDYINAAFSTLAQLGVGPVTGFAITSSSAIWSDFIASDLTLNPVKTYIALRSRILFDPPPSQFLLDSLARQLEELEWRLNVTVDPGPTT